MLHNLHVSCSECVKENNLSIFLRAAFDRIKNFWDGNERAPVVIKDTTHIDRCVMDTRIDNFSADENSYATVNFFLDQGICEIKLYPYRNGTKYPDFATPLLAYKGKYVL